MKTAVVIVLYEPSEKEIEVIIEKANLFDKVIIYDNSNQSHKKWFDLYNNFEYEYNGKNDGLAVAYNYALSFCTVNNIDWLFILDQDSSMDENNILSLLSFLDKTEKDIAIICPFVKYKESEKAPTIEVEAVEWTINSGSFLNVNLLRSKNIWYDEYYFLDRLDRDFCMQNKVNGNSIIRINNSVLKQSLGESVNGRNVHSPLRNYYMARNRLYYNHKFFPIPKRWFLNILQTSNHLFQVVVAKYRTREQIRMIVKGIKDYHHNISGKVHD